MINNYDADVYNHLNSITDIFVLINFVPSAANLLIQTHLSQSVD